MKKAMTLTIVALGLMTATTFAQLRKVPAGATNALKTKFPKATDVTWKDNLTDWKAELNDDGVKTSVYFSGKGEWKETDRELTYEALPQAVKDGFKKSKYNDWTPGSVVAIEKKDKEFQYRVYAEKSSLVQKKYLYFSKDGVLQKDAQTI